jgi:hypothetical protein
VSPNFFREAALVFAVQPNYSALGAIREHDACEKAEQLSRGAEELAEMGSIQLLMEGR